MLELSALQQLTHAQLIDLLRKADAVIEAAHNQDSDADGVTDYTHYSSAYLVYDAARDVVRDASRN